MKPFVLAAWTFFNYRNRSWIYMGILRIRLGRLVVLGSSRKCIIYALVNWNRLASFFIIVEKRKSLRAWVLLLSILAFLLSVIGTFLVRSGILTSVHTFALDPSRGIYILVFTAILGGYSLILFAKKSKKYFDNNYFALFSKEGSILINNVLMIAVCATVFLGTIYPLIIEAFTTKKFLLENLISIQPQFLL